MIAASPSSLLKAAPVVVQPSRSAVRPAVPAKARYAAVAAKRSVGRIQAQTEEQSMNAAQARWDAQIKEGKVKNVTTKECGDLMKDGWVMLDVRPPEEIEKGRVEGAVEVPVFIADTDVSLGSLIKQMSAFGMGGWWLGGTHMKPYDRFLPDVLAKVPKDANMIVGCQKGLRSLAACEQLSRAGYKNLAWVNGGFDTAEKGDLPTEGDKDIRFAGIGGLSSVVGWTDVQQQESKDSGMGGGVGNVLGLVALVVVLDLAVFAYEQFQYMNGAAPPP